MEGRKKVGMGLDGEVAPWKSKAVDATRFCVFRGRIEQEEIRRKEGGRKVGELGSSECFLPFTFQVQLPFCLRQGDEEEGRRDSGGIFAWFTSSAGAVGRREGAELAFFGCTVQHSIRGLVSS